MTTKIFFAHLPRPVQQSTTRTPGTPSALHEPPNRLCHSHTSTGHVTHASAPPARPPLRPPLPRPLMRRPRHPRPPASHPAPGITSPLLRPLPPRHRRARHRQTTSSTMADDRIPTRPRASSGPTRLDGGVVDDDAHRQCPRGSTGASSSATTATTTRTVRADAALRARHGRQRAPSGPTRLDGRVVVGDSGNDDAHRQGRCGSTGASWTTTRTVRADAARRAPRRRWQRRRRRAPSGPTRLDGRLVVCSNGDNDAHRQGPRGSTGASSSVTSATTTRTVRADAARRARHG